MAYNSLNGYPDYEDTRPWRNPDAPVPLETQIAPDDYTDESIPTAEELNELYNFSAEETASFYLGEAVEYVSNLMLFIYLCNKFVVKKDFTLSSKETMFLVLMLLKPQFPIIGLGLFAIQIPTTIKIVKGWFKNNINKRSVLEAELRLIKQV